MQSKRIFIVSLTLLLIYGCGKESPPPAAPQAGAGQAAPATFRDCDECPEMVAIPAGSFLMGSPSSEAQRGLDEEPQHQVTIANKFAVGKFEVTFSEWDACVNDRGCVRVGHAPGPPDDDEGWGRGRQPVIKVAWSEAKQYVDWLSRKTGKKYRLLSEAEWEYVARAGTTTPFSTGATINPKQANYDAKHSYAGGATGQPPQRTVAVGSFKPNAFGLHDVHGNVSEWVEDCWNEDYKGAPSDGSAWTTGDCERRVCAEAVIAPIRRTCVPPGATITSARLVSGPPLTASVSPGPTKSMKLQAGARIEWLDGIVLQQRSVFRDHALKRKNNVASTP